MQAQNEIRTFEYESMIVRVHIPYLTDDEKKRHAKQLFKAAEALLKSHEKKIMH